jgi:Uma2 family endonuclease
VPRRNRFDLLAVHAHNVGDFGTSIHVPHVIQSLCPTQHGTRYHQIMATRTLLTFEQFEQLQDDGKKHELLKGELLVLPPPKLRHTRIQQKLQDALRPYVLRHQLGEVNIEAGFRLSNNTYLQPDVSFVRTSQIEQADPDAYYQGAPALAVEVVSDANTAAEMDLKIEEYFAHGGEEVWLIYPKTRKLRIHHPDGRSETVAGGTLESTIFLG